MPQRPQGVTVIAVLMIIGGALGIVGALVSISLATTLAGAFGAMIALAVVIPLVISVGQVIVGLGLLRLLQWARMAAIAITVVGAIFAIVSLVAGGSVGANIVSLIIDGVILWYLFRPEVKQAFER